METGPAFVILRSGAPRLEIRGHGRLVEVVVSDRYVVDPSGRLAFPHHDNGLPNYELVVAVPFIHGATDRALVEFGRLLQVAYLQGDVIDAISLESRRRRRAGSGRQ